MLSQEAFKDEEYKRKLDESKRAFQSRLSQTSLPFDTSMALYQAAEEWVSAAMGSVIGPLVMSMIKGMEKKNEDEQRNGAFKPPFTL